MVTVDDVRSGCSRLPRSSEVLVRDRVKFRVGQDRVRRADQPGRPWRIGSFAFPKWSALSARLEGRYSSTFPSSRASRSRALLSRSKARLDAPDADGGCRRRGATRGGWFVRGQRVAREVLGPPAAGHEPGRTGIIITHYVPSDWPDSRELRGTACGTRRIEKLATKGAIGQGEL